MPGTESLKNKVCIITGASSGIGEATAKAFAKEGCRLVIASRNIQKLEQVALACVPAEVISIKADVSIEEDCKKIITTALEKFGCIDILICNAGVSMRASFSDVDIRVMKQLMDTNFWGTVYCSKYALPHLLKSKGSLLAVSSITGFKGLPGRTGYAASKFAVNGFIDSLRIENLYSGVHVGLICPGFTATGIRINALDAKGRAQSESPRDEAKMMQAEEVAKEIVLCIRKRKRQKLLTFMGRLTVWVNKFFPGYVDRVTYKTMKKEPRAPF